ncbi:MAG: TIGR02597 family protein, partial [Verrucomicrobiae bacterium]|nr:TIGR02597 family protein [Verrucomicrobiae bacterium]
LHPLPNAGDAFVIFPAWTLDTLFAPGAGETQIAESLNFLGVNRGTEILFLQPRAAGINRSASAVFYRESLGWRSTANTTSEQGGFVIDPDVVLVVRGAGSQVHGATWVTVAGTMDAAEAAIATTIIGDASFSRDNTIGFQCPVPMPLASLGLVDSGAFQGSANVLGIARKDELLLFDNQTIGLNKSAARVYFYDLSAGLWKNAANPAADAGQDLVPAGAGLILRKASGHEGSYYWTFPGAF